MERHIRDALEEEVMYDHAQFGLLNCQPEDDLIVTTSPTPSRNIRAYKWSKLLRTAALCGAYVSLGLCFSVTGPTLLNLKEQVGASITEISYIYTARSAGTLGGSFLGGFLLDKCNPYSAFFVVIASMAISVGSMPWCKHLWMLMVSSVVIGMGNGFLDTGASTLCLQLWGKDSGPYMQSLHFAFAVGGSLAPLLVQAFIVEPLIPKNSSVISSRHVREVTLPINLTEAIENYETTLSYIAPNFTTTVLPTTINQTLATEKPKKPKPIITNGQALGASSQFDAIPLKNEPAEAPTTASTNLTEATTVASLNSTTTPIAEIVDNTTVLSKNESMELTTINANETITLAPILIAINETNNPETTTLLPTTVTTQKNPVNITEVTTHITTAGSTIALAEPTTTTSTTTPVAIASTEQTTTTEWVATKSRGKSRGQQDEPTISGYLERFGVTRMHMLYTVIAIIVLHTAFAFLFLLCSDTRNAITTNAERADRKIRPFRPAIKIMFIGLMFTFYLVYVGSEVIFAQFVTTFALESPLKLPTSTANYVTTTFWASFAAARFVAIFVAHFTNPTIMLFLNMALTAIGSSILCIAGQNSLVVLYVGSGLVGAGMASTFATGFVWTEMHLLVTNRISAAFSIASSLGEMIFPTVTGSLMEAYPMSLMYFVLSCTMLCMFVFLGAGYLTRNKNRNFGSSSSGYQLARQDESNQY